MLSRCCKRNVETYCGNEGTSFYYCVRCERGTDPISIFGREPSHDDDTNATEVEAVADLA